MTEPATPEQIAQKLTELGAVARQFLDSPDQDCRRQRRVSVNYERELIQVAASAVAALVDLRTQQGEVPRFAYGRIISEIFAERQRQDRKFGSMPRRLDPLVWAVVLLEETAEVVEEVQGWRK